MKTKTLVLTAALMLTMQLCQGQEPVQINEFRIPNNSIYLEIFGSSLLYSFNYERNIFEKERLGLSARVGAGYADLSFSQPERDYVFPLTISILFQGYKRLYVEVGSGLTFKRDGRAEDEHEEWTYESNYYVTTNLGIRYQGKQGFLCRAAYTPFLDLQEDFAHGWWNGFGISLGFSFGNGLQDKHSANQAI
jgi:hypothetical protein